MAEVAEHGVANDDVVAADEPGPRASRITVVAYFVFLTALCALVFLPSLKAGFFMDDFGYFNVTMQPGWWHSAPAWDLAGQVLRPVTILAIGAQRDLLGFHPLAFHVLALGLLLVEGVLLYLIGLRLSLSRTGALAATTVLMLHTTNGWAISWTASTSSNYGAIFGLGAILLVLRPEVGRRRMAAACAVLVVALLAREVTMVVPFIVIALRCLLLEGEFGPRVRRSIREARPLLGVLIGYLSLRFLFAAWAHNRPQGDRLIPLLNLTSVADTVPWIPVHTRDLLTLGTSPIGIGYRWGQLDFPAVSVALAAVVWALVIAGTVREARAGRWVATAGLAWFAIGIIPPLFLQPDMVYGNYTDLAAPGLALAVGAIAQRLLSDLRPRWRPLAAVGGITCLALLAVIGGNYLISEPVPAFIQRAWDVEAQLRAEYPEPPPPGSTVVIWNSQPDDQAWLSNGDLVRVLFDDRTLVVEFEPGPKPTG